MPHPPFMFRSDIYRTAAALSRRSQSEIFGGILRGGRGHVAALATQGVPAMPDWQPDPEDKRQAAGWPLRLLTAPGYFQSHTAYSGVSFLRRREGPACCILHPEEAGARDLWDGRRVRLFNDRGVVGLVLKVSDEIQPGVVLVPGQRPDGETVTGTINVLCSDRYTDIGEGATYQSHWVDIAVWDNAAT
jgi:anaerobic selenocysteine-containing dehydrogenase